MTVGPGRLIVIAGPTGTGKSDLALAVAEQLDGEIVNADSMQLYRGMDIGTAKLTATQQRGVPHHLLDVLEVTQTASVAAYQRQARGVIGKLLASGRTPILAGGSGLYINAVVDELDFPGTDPQLRDRWLAVHREHGVARLHAELAARDPVAAAAIPPENTRRIVRALEVIELTGGPYQARLPNHGRPRFDARLLYLDRPTPELDDRLGRRVHRMMAAGLLDEVRRLAAAGLRDGLTARRALGYRQLLQHLDDGVPLVDSVAAIIVATRRFVRRQRSWFGRDPRWTRLSAGTTSTLEDALRAVTTTDAGP